MSRIFEALQQSSNEATQQSLGLGTPAKVADLLPRNGEVVSPPRAGSTFTLPTAPERRLVAVNERLGFGAEKLRMLSARLKYAQHRARLKRLLITSTIVGEGKTTITANLAVSLAQQQQRVLVVDGDLHQAALTSLFGLSSRPGIGECWQQQREVDEAIHVAEGLPLWVLPAGKMVEQPLAMLHSAEFQQLIESLSNRFDWVVIDSPPLAPLADAATWATICDGVLLITRKSVTPKNLLQESLALLDKSKLLGVVLNDADTREERYYKRYYDHSVGSRAAASTERNRK